MYSVFPLFTESNERINGAVRIPLIDTYYYSWGCHSRTLLENHGNGDAKPTVLQLTRPISSASTHDPIGVANQPDPSSLA